MFFTRGLKILCLFLFVVLISICCDNRKKVRKYREIVISTERSEQIPINKSDNKFGNIKWEKPINWISEKSSSSMRLATFSVESDGNKAICTLISLKGDGGGLRPNVLRWLGQLNIKMKSNREVDQFISDQSKFRTSGNLPVFFIDFTLLSATPSDISMLVGIVNLQDSTIFVKMTGKKSILIKSKENFISLCKSLTLDS